MKKQAIFRQLEENARRRRAEPERVADLRRPGPLPNGPLPDGAPTSGLSCRSLLGAGGLGKDFIQSGPARRPSGAIFRRIAAMSPLPNSPGRSANVR